jgi:hypothetical protein
MPYQHDFGIAEVLTDGIHIRRVRGHVYLLAIDGQTAAAVTAVVKMSNRQQLG